MLLGIIQTKKITLLLTFIIIFCVAVSSSEVTDTAQEAQQDDFLERNAQDENVISLPSGLQYKPLRYGMGLEHPGPDSRCLVRYIGKLASPSSTTNKPFVNRQSPIKVDHVLLGWQEILQRMVEGDNWEVTIPPHLAYGDLGSPSQGIPSNSTLIYKIELQSIMEEGSSGIRLAQDRCDLENPVHTGCSEKVVEYLERARMKFSNEKLLNRELRKLERHIHTDRVHPEIEQWVHVRHAIIKLLIKEDEERRRRDDVEMRDEL